MAKAPTQIQGVIKNFDLDSIIKKRARLNASGGVDLVTGINAIDPRIAALEVGDTLPLKVEKPEMLRKQVMGIVAKLNNLTPKGAPWEGRFYKVVSDPDDSLIYIQRGENGTPVERKRGRSGGRPAAPVQGEGGAVEVVTV